MNPELRRNLWLEATPQRLVILPLVLLLIFTAGWLMDRHALSTFTAGLAVIVYVLLAIVWGSRLSAAALTQEFEQGTWDNQRISGLSASAMVLGKLFGGAAMAWYGGLLCLLVYLCTALKVFSPAPLSFGVALETVLILLGAALVATSLALMNALLRWRKLHRSGAQHAVLFYIVLALLFFHVDGFSALLQLVTGHVAAVQWYGLQCPGLAFYALSSIVFAAWSLLGAIRLMRRELGYRNHPWWWLMFLLFVTTYLGGWLSSGPSELLASLIGLQLPSPLLQMALGSIVCGALVYLTLFYAPLEALQLHRLRMHWRGNAFPLDNLPTWLPTLAMTAVFVGAFCVLTLVLQPAGTAWPILAGAVNSLCFLLRDVAFFLWLYAAPRTSRRGDTAGLVYLAAIYALLPWLLILADQTRFTGLFNPLLAFDQPVWLLAGAIELAAMLTLLKVRGIAN